jgi:anti-sigma regulatory factor (Ser/Thr protein kinase)
MLAGLGDQLGFDSELLDDLKTAVSEACNNVAMHAYSNGVSGPMLVGLRINADGVEATVRDHGGGIQHVMPTDERMGVGLAVISALADRAEFLSSPDGGTEVRMSFSGKLAHGKLDGAAGSSDHDASVPLSGDVVATLSPVALLPGVLGRVSRALAAGARFSLDRFSDLYLVTDAIAAHSLGAARGSRISFAIVASSRRLELTIGPYRVGTGSKLVASSSEQRHPPPLGVLADELAVEPAGDAELLRLVLVDHRNGTSR